ncbi:hypothetical protein BX666DRAFT_1992646 [Dichotomocladium elegans]|nr:hypothetical protein BX666DRAFT_1992646 [Dichotomocladium elegans]
MFILEQDDPDWLLVKLKTGGCVGLAPHNYVQSIETDTVTQQSSAPSQRYNDQQQPVDDDHNDDVDDQPIAVSTPTPVSAAPPILTTPVLPQRTGGSRIDLAEDEAQSWSVHEYDRAKKKKKKGKGNLLVGTGMLCYGSETDKSLPVQQYPILDVTKYLFDGKTLHIEVEGQRPAVLDLQASSKSEAKAILVKITDSRTIAQRAATRVADGPSPTNTGASGIPTSVPSISPRSITPPPETAPAPASAGISSPSSSKPQWGTILYTFDAEGGEEISVRENEQVYILESARGDGWWRVQKTSGAEGLVPETYVQLDNDDNHAAETEEVRLREEEAERQRQQELEAQEKQRRQQQEEEQRRAEEERQRRAAEEARQRQEAQRREEEERRKKVQEAAQRAEAARQRQLQAEAEQRKAAQRTSTLPSRPSEPRDTGVSRSQSVSSRQQDLPKPDPKEVRTWTDRSGAFKVEAQFLAFYDGKFRLHKTNGVKIDVAVDKMSTEDIRWVERRLGRSIIKGSSNSSISALAQVNPPTPPMPPRPVQGRQESELPSSAATAPPPPSAFSASPRAVAEPSSSSAASTDQPKPIFAKKEKKKVNPNWDWFDWFMMIGIPMEASLKYSASFQADKLDDSDIPSLTHKRIKTMGVSEKHTRRIERFIETEKPEPPSDDEGNDSREVDQKEQDEAFARRLHRELNGNDAPVTAAIASSPRAKPKPTAAAPAEIHPDLLEFVGSQFTGAPSQSSQVPDNSKPKTDLIGFEDDAWAPRATTASASSEALQQEVLQPVNPEPAPTAANAPVPPSTSQQQHQPQQKLSPIQPQMTSAEQANIQKIQQMQIDMQKQQIEQQKQQLQQLQLQAQQLQQQQERQQQEQLQRQIDQQQQILQQQKLHLEQQQIQMQQHLTLPPRQRPVSVLKHMADPSLSRWQQPTSGNYQNTMTTGQVQQQNPAFTGMDQFMPQQQQQQQPAWQTQGLQPNMTGVPNYQQPMATSTVPLSSVLPPALVPSRPQPTGLQPNFIGPQPTGARNWLAASKS